MKKSKKVFGIIIGIISIIGSINILLMDNGGYEMSLKYGGDAYTGIQNSSAQAANNIQCLTEVVQNGFASVLFIFGLTMIFLFASNIIVEKSKKNVEYSNATKNYQQSQSIPNSYVQNQYSYQPNIRYIDELNSTKE